MWNSDKNPHPILCLLPDTTMALISLRSGVFPQTDSWSDLENSASTGTYKFSYSHTLALQRRDNMKDIFF